MFHYILLLLAELYYIIIYWLKKRDTNFSLTSIYNLLISIFENTDNVNKNYNNSINNNSVNN